MALESKQLFSPGDKRWLDQDVQVWRYVPLRTLFFYLNGLVFVPSIAKLRAGDPFEGEFFEDTAWFNTAFHSHYGKEASAIDSWMHKELCSDYERRHIELNRDYPNAAAEVLKRCYFAFIRRTRFAWCWFQSYRESAAMWSVYGNQGVAIQSTVGKLSAMLGKDFIYGRMIYADYRGGVSADFCPESAGDYLLLLRPYFLKRKEYESEHEVRFVTCGPDPGERGGVLLKDLNPKDWISEIRLWPGLTFEEERSISKIVKQYIPEPNCSKSDLFSGPEGRFFWGEEFRDMMEQSEASKWKEGQDGIPAPVKAL